jgi:hypothetical protein
MYFYNYAENNYGEMDVQGDIMDAIEALHEKYEVDFPAGDFLYPTFTDDLIQNSDKISFLGTCDLDGESCFLVAAKNSEMTIQIWLANDATTLPVKFVINYLSGSKHKGQYEGTFSNWKMNPDLPDAMFNFTIPPNANPLSIVPAK